MSVKNFKKNYIEKTHDGSKMLKISKILIFTPAWLSGYIVKNIILIKSHNLYF